MALCSSSITMTCLSNPTESDCTSCMPTSRATGSRSGALERTRFAPSLGRKHSTTVTLRRIARRGPYCLIPLHIGISSGCSRTGIRLAVLEGIQEAFFPKIPLNGRCSRLSRQCTPEVHACPEPLPLRISQFMRANSRVSERCLATSHVLCAGHGKERR